MSTLECPHYDLATATEVDPQSRTTFEKLFPPQHDVNLVDAFRDINDTQAKTRNLPPEILSTIFEFACPPIDFSSRFEDWYPGFNTFRAEDTFHFILATVCHHWREVVLSAPQLWTTITLRPNKPGRSIQNATSLVNLYFERARALPISLELDFQGEKAEWYANRDEPVKVTEEYLDRLVPLMKAVFIDGVHQIQHLSLIQIPSGWLPVVNEDLSQCTSFALFDPMSVIVECEDDGDEKKGGKPQIDGESGERSGEGSDEERDGVENENNDGGNAEGSGEDDEDNADDNDEFWPLNLAKLPRLKRIDLVSVMNIDNLVSFPTETETIRIRRFRRLHSLFNSLLFSMVLDSLTDSLKSFLESRS